MSERLRVIVLGYVIRGPLGGLAWHHLQYVLGLVGLGHEVLFLEDGSDDPHACYDPGTHRVSDDCSYGLRFAAAAFAALGVPTCWAYRPSLEAGWIGPAAAHVPAFCRTADLLLNVSGVNPLHALYARVPVKVFVDTDPAFQQVRVLTDPTHATFVRQHTHHFTFATSITSPTHGVPDDGIRWLPTIQPVHLASWSVTPIASTGALTTVMQWDSYERRSWNGIVYGMKAESFAPFIDLPRGAALPLELAIGSPTAPRRDLREHGWIIRDPLEVTRSLTSYQAYIASSLGEFSVAKHGYVVSRCGWFGERTANYLASGRPAIVQDTGFTDWLPCGEGLLAFDSPADALGAIEAVAADPARHGRRARELAEEHFDSSRVLVDLIERVA